jgi:hypothetical protein
MLAMSALLDELLPDYDVNEVHTADLPGDPADALAAARAVTPGEIRFMGPLMTLRSLPGRIRRTPIETTPEQPFMEQALGLGFVLLGERADEVVVGAIGRFWSPAGNRPLRFRDREEFLAFEEPGYAKALMNFAVRPHGSGTLISTETRIAGTDPGATRRFRAYWLLIGPWSGLIRRGMLRAVERRVTGA